MRGLLLKDWYMVRKYCKSYIFIAAFFIAVSFINNNNVFFLVYPCLLCGMIPINLLGYDERSRWDLYSGTLPYTRVQLVTVKYLIGLLTQLAMLVVTVVAQVVKMNLTGDFSLRDILMLAALTLPMATITSSITLPFIFKLGVEKGRIGYYVMVGAIFAAGAIVYGMFGMRTETEINLNVLLPGLAFAGIGIYVLSWFLSVSFYNKREIQ